MSPILTEVTILALSAAVGSASWLICKTEITLPLRVWIAKRSAGRFFGWLSKLLKCPYCTGTWLSVFAVAIYRPRIVHMWLPLDLLVSVFVTSGLSMLPVLWIKKALT